MTITLRSTKGVALTYSELDGNFSDLNTRVNAKLSSSSVSTFGLSLISTDNAADARDTLGVDIGKLVNGDSEFIINSDGSIQAMYQASNERTGSGQALLFSKFDGGQKIIGTQNGTAEFPVVERLVIVGGDGYGTGEGGDIYLWAGRSDRNNAAGGQGGGDIKIDAGDGYDSPGGTVKIRGGTVFLDQGTAPSNGGFIEITAGESYDGGDGGNITLIAGNAYNEGNDGAILLSTGKGTHNWSFDRDGNLVFPDNTLQTTAYTGTVTTGFALTIGEPNSYTDFRVVTLDELGYVYFCGSTSSLTPDNSPTIIKMDTAGRTVIWQTTLEYDGTITAAFAYSGEIQLFVLSTGPVDVTWSILIDASDGSVIASNYYDQDTDSVNVRDTVLGVDLQYAASVGSVNTGVSNGLLSVESGLGSYAIIISEDGGLGDVHYYGIANNPENGDIYAVGRSDTYGSIVSYYTVADGLQWHMNIDLGVSDIRATSVDYSNGYIYVVSHNFDNNDDGFLTKMDANSGSISWQKAMGYNASGDTEPLSIANGCVSIDADGNIIVGWNYISGNSRWLDFLIVKFDIHGDIQWQRSIGTEGADTTATSVSTEFLTADDTHIYLALQADGDGEGQGVGGAIQIALDGTGAGTYGNWWYTNQSWGVYNQNITAGSLDITENLISTPYTLITSSEQNITNILTESVTEINLIGGGITTGNITFVESTIRGPSSPINNFKVRIQPSLSYTNTLAIYPTGDDDIHLFEDSNLGGGITLGDYGKSNISVWGNGGTSTTVDDIALSAINNGTIVLKTNDSANRWYYNTDGSLDFPGEAAQPYRMLASQYGYYTTTAPVVIFAGTPAAEAAKATIHVKGSETVGTISTTYHQICEMLIVRKDVYDSSTLINTTTVEAIVYGVTHTSATPMATFDVQWNNTLSVAEITMVRDAAYTGVNAKVIATESVNLD